jgi:hypothetical protein
VPWSKSRPRGKSVDPKYQSKEHRDARAAMKAQIERDGYGYCAQPVCVMPSRLITLTMRWCAGHNDAGTAYIGPVHQRCNVRDGAKRGRARQNATTLKW